VKKDLLLTNLKQISFQNSKMGLKNGNLLILFHFSPDLFECIKKQALSVFK